MVMLLLPNMVFQVFVLVWQFNTFGDQEALYTAK